MSSSRMSKNAIPLIETDVVYMLREAFSLHKELLAKSFIMNSRKI